jgi:O-6-methylguanine DNA methyltransferase
MPKANIEGARRIRHDFHEKTVVCGFLKMTLRIHTLSNLLSEVILPQSVPENLTWDCIQDAYRKLGMYETLPPRSLKEFHFLEALDGIPAGSTRTYGSLAKNLGSSPRGIASRCSANRLLIRIPCHRVVSGDGIGGYRAGVGWKKALLRLEANSHSAHDFQDW